MCAISSTFFLPVPCHSACTMAPILAGVSSILKTSAGGSDGRPCRRAGAAARRSGRRSCRGLRGPCCPTRSRPGRAACRAAACCSWRASSCTAGTSGAAGAGVASRKAAAEAARVSWRRTARRSGVGMVAIGSVRAIRGNRHAASALRMVGRPRASRGVSRPPRSPSCSARAGAANSRARSRRRRRRSGRASAAPRRARTAARRFAASPAA